ncbi:hypothetical protein EDC96DRAFT_590223 [Choanephora cucurbitarum]|nr:hypothetical protein EDC96DRAFT_590223 [Choanephora cucurbitarum]
MQVPVIIEKKKLIFLLSENRDKISKKKIEKLQQNVACFEAISSSKSSFRPVLDLEDERIAHLVTKINNQITDFYIILVKTYILALAFKERQLSGSGKIGLKKAAKLVLSIKHLASSAKNAIRLLNKHLQNNCIKRISISRVFEHSKCTNENLGQEEVESNQLESLGAAIKKFPKESSLALSEDVLAWHKLCRIQEELQLLKDEEKRFVDNLDRKIYFVELAIEQAKPEHVVLIGKQRRKLALLKKITSVFLDIPVSSPFLPSFPSTNEVSLSDAIPNESDDIVDGGEIISIEDKEDELAPLVSILSE